MHFLWLRKGYFKSDVFHGAYRLDGPRRHITFLGSLCFFLLSIGITDTSNTLRFVPNVHASSTYYVSPSGSGTSCSQSSPCSLTEGLKQAQAGDEVVLMDGVYTSTFTTSRSGTSNAYITIRAQNQHKAIFRKGSGNITDIRHNYLIIRGIRFDGMKTGGANGGIRIGHDSATGVHHVIFEHNIVENMGYSCVHITMGQRDLIVRHNLINGCGFVAHWGEGFYIGNKTDPKLTVYNLQIYGNDVRNFTEQGLETKHYSRNIEVHHNIFSGQIPAVEQGATQGVTASRGQRNHGTITLLGTGNIVHNNIMRQNKSGWGSLSVAFNAEHKAFNNVHYDEVHNPSAPTQWAVRAYDDGNNYRLAASRLYKNTFCNLTTYAISGHPGLLIYDNNGVPGSGVARSQCLAEAQRILDEMKYLPGATSLSVQLPTPLNLRLKSGL